MPPREPESAREPGGLDARVVLGALLLGLVAGGLASAFRFALDSAETVHDSLARSLVTSVGVFGWLAVGLGAAVIGGLARWLVLRFAPETSGSGIPVVEIRLEREEPIRWPRVIAVKFAGGFLALFTGLSLGREGPTVQMGAAVGEAIGALTGGSAQVRRALVAAGAGAGLTGAFGAPIAGALFVIEELRRELSVLTYVTALVAALAAQLVTSAVFGPEPILGAIDPPPLPLAGLLLAAVCGAACGVAGVAFNRLLLLTLDVFASWRSVPLWVHGAAAAALAVAVSAFLPSATFGDESVASLLVHGSLGELVTTRGGLLAGTAASAAGLALFLAVLFVTKIGLTAASYGSGVVGGIFAPLLVMGAALGALVGQLAPSLGLDDGAVGALAGAGAVAMFTASVRVPVTGIVLLLEMTGSIHQGLAFAIAGAVAYLVAAALRDEPIYEALGRRTPDPNRPCPNRPPDTGSHGPPGAAAPERPAAHHPRKRRRR